MPLSELERKRAERIVGRFVASRRPPPPIRAKVDLAFRVSGDSVEIFEIRAAWHTPEKRERSVAMAVYARAEAVWRVFWQHADLEWHLYEPAPEVDSLEEFVSVVAADKHACFFG